jgi:protein TonB
MSKLFKMRPMTKDGQPVGGGKITIPIVFRLPKG